MTPTAGAKEARPKLLGWLSYPQHGSEANGAGRWVIDSQLRLDSATPCRYGVTERAKTSKEEKLPCSLTMQRVAVMCDNALKNEKVRQNVLESAIT